MPKKRRIVVLGGALSGPTAAARAREIDPDAKIILLERADAISYAVGGLPYYLSGEVDARADLAPLRAAFFKRNYNVDIRTGVSVKRFDATARKVYTSAGVVSYDSLIYALGAGSLRPHEFGDGGSNLSYLRTMADLQRIDRILKRGASQAVVVGGGYYGVEAADCLARRGVSVTLLEREDQLLPEFSAAAAKRAAQALAEQGVDVQLGAVVEGVKRKGKRIVSVQTARGSLATDLILITAGVAPRSEIFVAAGGRVQRDRSILVDRRCATNLPDVYATSICVSHRHAITQTPVWTTQAADADKTAQVAGANAAGGSAQLAPTLDTAIVRAGELHLARTGLTELALHPRAASIHVGGYSSDPFFRGSAPLAITLVYDRESERVLGAEIVGQGGVDKRIDVIATAIVGKLKLGQLAQLDLAYSPPYSTTRDLVNAAGLIGQQAQDVRAWTAAELQRATDTWVFDLRTPAQRKATPSIPGATAVTLAAVSEHRRRLARAAQVVFISARGREGYLAARQAAHYGCEDAGYLCGGMAAWEE